MHIDYQKSKNKDYDQHKCIKYSLGGTEIYTTKLLGNKQ